MNEKEIFDEIESELTQNSSFIYIYSFLSIITNYFGSVEDLMNEDPRLKYTTDELALIAGLFLKNGSIYAPTLISQGNFETVIDKTWDTFQKLHGIISQTPYKETIFYSNSGAFDFQFVEFLEERFKRDEEWIFQKKGFKIKTAKAIFYKLRNLQLRKISNIRGGEFEKYLTDCFDGLCFSKEDLISENITENELDSFLQCFSIEPGGTNEIFEQIGDRNLIYSKPIIKLEDNKYFLPLVVLLSQALYREPIDWMIKEDRLYFDKYGFKNRGDSSEDIAYHFIAQVFGTDKTFQNIDIYDIAGNRLTEADVLCFVGDKAIIFQVKSKVLTVASRKGDIDSIRNDYHKAIEHARDQGILAKMAFLNGGFSYRNKDQTVFLPPCQIDEAFVVCLTSDAFPGALPLGFLLNKEDDITDPAIPISLFDLEVIAYYLKDPFEFLFYIKQRTIFAQKVFAISELAILGMHLKQGLYLEENERMAIDDTCQNNIIGHYLFVRGMLPPSIENVEAPISRWKNGHFSTLIDKLKSTCEKYLTDAILFLYHLSSDSREDIFEIADLILTDLRKNSYKMFKNGTLVFGDKIICIVCSQNFSTLEKDMWLCSHAKKYELKASMVLVIGFAVESGLTIRATAFSKAPWEYDAEMEEMTIRYNSKTNPKKIAGNGRIVNLKNIINIKRKSPCPCGSGKKYKRCCGK